MNLESFQNILIVDNEKDELDTLATIFQKELQCDVKTHLYDQSEEQPEPFNDVRLVFFDLNITPDELTKDNSGKAFNGLQNALKDVISIENKPYALIFWTKHAEYVKSFKDYVKGRPLNDLASPAHIGCLDKVAFESSSDKVQLIRNELQSTVFYKLMEFEKILKREVESVMYNILDIANEDSMSIWDDTYHSNLQSFLRTVSSKHAGFNHAQKNPSKSLTEALTPIITDKFIKACDSKKVWDDLLDFTNVNKSQCVFSKNNNIPKLNNFFHVDISENAIETRGSVLELTNPKKFFKDKFNISKESRIVEATICNFPKQSRSVIEFILLEISPACDYSQNKERFHKYIVGLKLPKNCYELYIESLKVKSKVLPQSTLDLKLTLHDESSNDEFHIIFNKNYVINLNHTERADLAYLFTLKKEMMDYIGNQYANHVSRIGITSF